MKNYKELTTEELANLTDEQIDKYKKLMYAEEGIQFPEKPKEIDEVNIPKDLTVYKISGLSSYDGPVFGSLEDAKKVLECLNSCNSFGHIESKNSEQYFDLGTRRDYYGENCPLEINTTQVYSKEKYLEVQDTLVQYKKLREQYKKDQEQYENIYNKAIEVTEEFCEALSNAQNIMYHRKTLANKYYCDYLPLADNNSEIAMNFLKKAYTVSEEDEQYILNNSIKTE